MNQRSIEEIRAEMDKCEKIINKRGRWGEKKTIAASAYCALGWILGEEKKSPATRATE